MGKKIARTTIVVKDKKNGKTYTNVAEQMPRAKEPGLYLYVKVNSLGVELLQERGHIEQTVNQKNFGKWVSGILDLPEEAIGRLGNINPDTNEGADQWEVMVGDDVVFPQGEVSVTPSVAEPTIVAPTDTTPVVAEPAVKNTFDSAGAVLKIVEYKKQGLGEAEILQGLMKKIPQAQAEALIEQALRPKVEAQKKDLF